ncbi:cation-transporting P-type ATPase [Rhodoplanes elegans]|nr:cation-transporting P-type ATPase [Rhodoplanes elegans]
MNGAILEAPSSAQMQARTEWHAISGADAIDRLQSRSSGLTDLEARQRLERHGFNRLPTAQTRSAISRLVAQFNNRLIYVLLISAAITALLGHGIDAGVILGVVVVNALVGFVQEGRAERALGAIKAMISTRATVLRDGHRLMIDAEKLVPGDIVLIEAGDRVPADLRLLRARNLKIDESALTGESIAAEKDENPVDARAALGDRQSMAYAGTFVVAGQGQGIAVATGLDTEIGHISSMLRSVETLTTPLIRQINHFARYLTFAILGFSSLVFVLAVWLRSYPWTDAFMIVVGLAVAAIPEGLPAVMTVTLAIGVQKMAARHAIVRQLPAVETLGSVSVICSDKTGTLTQNEMTVRTVVTKGGVTEVTGIGYDPRGAFRQGAREIDSVADLSLRELALAALLCNNAVLRRTDTDWAVDGDPMEGALVSLAIKAGYDVDTTWRQFPRTDEIPFDSRHRYMATLHHGHDDGFVAYVKGAPEQVIAMCSSQHASHGAEPIDLAHWNRMIDALGANGQRVLALAKKPMPRGAHELTFQEVERDLVLIGLVGLIDPPREEAITAVAECATAGIRVKMITGDHAATATAVARQLGLERPDAVITGDRLNSLDDEAFRRAAKETTVFARTTPEHKLRLVEALQADGAIVAMTGDGVNDAPALKRADVGIAMGRKGTEAAKEAAEVVLADDNFATIVSAIREGRTVHDNLIKVIGWTLPTNAGEAMTIVMAILIGLTLPLTPVQILWVNMVTAVGLGLTLAFEPPESDVMQRPPRAPDAPILSGILLWRVIFVSLLFVAGAFGMFFWAEKRGLSIEQAHTVVVNTIVVLEIFYLFGMRYRRASAFTWPGVFGTPAVLAGIGFTLLAQLLFTYAPFMQAIFATRAVSFADGLLVIATGVTFLFILELEKFLLRRLHPQFIPAGTTV